MAKKLRPCLLIYDIPEHARIPNPSRFLRRRAVRINLSCWVIPEAEIPYNLLNQMEVRGAVCRIVRFADEEVVKLQKIIAEEIRKAIERANERARRSMRNAVERLTEAIEDGADPNLAEARQRASINAAFRRASLLLNDLKDVGAVFDLGAEPGRSVTAAASRLTAAHATYTAKAKLVAAACEEAAKIGDGRMGVAAKADLVPVGILSDYIKENNGDTADLDEAFSDAQEID